MIGMRIPVLESVLTNKELIATMEKVFAIHETIPLMLAEDNPKYHGHKKGTYLGEIYRVDVDIGLADVVLSHMGEDFAQRRTYDKGLVNELEGTVIDIEVRESELQENVFSGHADLIRPKDGK